jgi:hypothetical protein
MATTNYESAANANYLIETVGRRVDLCEQQGGQWITIRRGINRATAERFLFDVPDQSIGKVFRVAEQAEAMIDGN